MKINKERLPNDLISALQDFKEFFEILEISYWLGGGLLQKIHEEDYEAIKASWEGRNRHDIDFYCMQKDKDVIEQNDFLIQRGYQKISHFYHKQLIKRTENQSK